MILPSCPSLTQQKPSATCLQIRARFTLMGRDKDLASLCFGGPGEKQRKLAAAGDNPDLTHPRRRS